MHCDCPVPMGKRLFYKFGSTKRWHNQVVYSATKTSWGQGIHNGSAGAPEGWIGGITVGQFVMRNEGWSEWKVAFGSGAMTSKATLYQQYSCHVLGGFYDWAGDWNLEKARSNYSTWPLTALSHCDW